MQNIEAVKRLFSSALGFYKAAEIVQGHKEFQLWPPIYVSLFYALEMSLKAFLASRGMDRAALKGFNHRLSILINECEKAGMVFPNPRFHEFVGQIDGKLMEIRYLEGDDIEVAEAPEALELTWQHLISVWAHIPYDKLPGWDD
jgi:hypothetical protein